MHSIHHLSTLWPMILLAVAMVGCNSDRRLSGNLDAVVSTPSSAHVVRVLSGMSDGTGSGFVVVCVEGDDLSVARTAEFIAERCRSAPDEYIPTVLFRDGREVTTRTSISGPNDPAVRITHAPVRALSWHSNDKFFAMAMFEITLSSDVYGDFVAPRLNRMDLFERMAGTRIVIVNVDNRVKP
jgi:hypothetical protein